MKIKYVLWLLSILLLCGCSRREQIPTVRAAVEESPWAMVENNGAEVLPGEDVTFRIRAEEGFFLTGTDYRGNAQIRQEGTEIELTLEQVNYPTLVSLRLTANGYAMRCEPNGGEGSAFTHIQKKSVHQRPNTPNALVPFSRPGYTLLGWNTSPDGTGTAAGLGSRITVPQDGLTLYAQWAQWTDASYFTWEAAEGGAVITHCTFTGDTLVIPAELGGYPVVRLAASAFDEADTVVLPMSLRSAEDGCFAAVRELYLFDNLEEFSDAAFPVVQTLHINAAEAPSGAANYRESCYADKLDLLILSQNLNRAVFYGGCSMWYNLDMNIVSRTLGDKFYPVNLALNGTVSSELQLRIMLPYLHSGDLFFHTPELASNAQMLRITDMHENENRIWSGIEYNYDLLTNADIRGIDGLLDSFSRYLGSKKDETAYADYYLDSQNRFYCGKNGEIPFSRYEPSTKELGDIVTLHPGLISEDSTQRLGQWYARFRDMGVSVYVSYACTNLDALPEEERGNIRAVDDAFRAAVSGMPDVVLLSELPQFVYQNEAFFDTNYHLLSNEASTCTSRWMKALKPYL